MKVRLLFITFLCIGFIGFSQTVSIPDPDFEQALINIGIDSDGTLNGQILTSDTDGVSTLDVSASDINDLTGIEAFGDLKTLICYENNLTIIDLSQNTVLIELQIGDNPLNTLNISNNLDVTTLNCTNTQLTTLNLSLNTALTSFECQNSLLESLNVKNGNNTSITFFNTNTNSDLVCIEVDDVAYSDANWTNIDAASSFSTNCATFGLTYVPDDNFEQALIDLGYDSGALDDYVTTTNINSVTFLNLFGKGISDLTGIEGFIALTQLVLNANPLTSIDISQNTNLLSLSCTNIPILSLDVSQNTNLIHLDCAYNQITTLDLSQNINLTSLACYNGQLTSLNVKNGNNINFTNFDARFNANLSCVEVDNAAYSIANWSNGVNTGTSFNTNCTNPETYVPDDNFENYLETHDASGTVVSVGDPTSMGNGIANDDYVTTANISSLTSIFLNNLNILDLTGIEDFIALTSLRCQNNQLTNLDLSQNINLTHIYCDNNELTSLNLLQNIALTHLYAGLNQLASIDISQNTALKTFYCDSNQLTSLSVFQNTDLSILHCNNNQLVSLDFTQNTILTEVYCNYNLLTSIDVTQNIALTDLFCNYNQLSNIDITQNINLVDFYCTDNQLTSLNLTNNNDLARLWCFDNELISLDITQNVALYEVRCMYNQLTNLDTSQNSVLRSLWCYDNLLANLDVSQNTAILRLRANNNQLSTLNVKNGNNTNFTQFQTLNNPNLTCIEVDDAAYSTANWTDIDPASSFSTDCSTLSADNFEQLDFSVYPNPSKEDLTISLQKEATYTLMDINGKQLKLGQLPAGNNRLDITSIPSGLYFLKVKTSNGVSTKKIIKQ